MAGREKSPVSHSLSLTPPAPDKQAKQVYQTSLSSMTHLGHVDHSASQFLRDHKTLDIESQLTLVGRARGQLEWNFHSLMAGTTHLRGCYQDDHYN